MTMFGDTPKAILGAALFVLCCASVTTAETFSTRDGFSVTLPPGWVQAPPEALQQMETAIGELTQGSLTQRYDYGFQLASAATWFEYPYILVQVRRTGRVPEGELRQYERIQSQFRDGLEQADASLGDSVSNAIQSEIRYDETEHVLLSTVTMNVENVGVVRGLVALKLTEFGFIQMMGYATDDTFAQYVPLFTEAVRTLDVADADAYQPRLTDRAPTIWGINLGQTAIAALIGGLGGALIGLAKYIRKRRGHSI
jgi:hypothetical protein